MAAKTQAIKFGSVNRNQIKLKNVCGKTSRTGQSTAGRVKAHGKTHKH